MRSVIANIRAEAARLRLALLAPDAAALEQTLPALEEAVRQLRQLERELAGGAAVADAERGGLRAEIQALQAELQDAARLNARGAEFWRGWARLLELDAGIDASYTAQGDAGPTRQAASPRVRVEG